jgi:hypothetical protein
MSTTKEQRYSQFASDMHEHGYEVKDYRGRNFYDGPSISIQRDDLQDVICATEIKLQWDSLGKSGLVVYPV